MSRWGLAPTQPNTSSAAMKPKATAPSRRRSPSRRPPGAFGLSSSDSANGGPVGMVPGHGEVGIGAANVEVVARVRPLNPMEIARGDATAVKPNMSGNLLSVETQQSAVDQTGAGMPRGVTKDFSFNRVVGPEIDQDQFFAVSGVQRKLDAAMQGYSVSIFAYGQTGAGKTHTIAGASADADDTALVGSQAGLLPRVCEYLVSQAATLEATYTFRASFLEIYNEQAYDLLNSTTGVLTERWNDTQGFFVENLFVVECDSVADLRSIISEGVRNRRVASHALNKDSSRSHSIFTIDMEITEPSGARKLGRVSLTDLAGSERLKDTKSGNSSSMLREASNINRSLFVLGKVISALGKADREAGEEGRRVLGQSRSSMSSGGGSFLPPYRDSLLTKLLMDSLGGSALTLLIACVSPSSLAIEESLSTLFYASRAKNIKNRPTVRHDVQAAHTAALLGELDRLKQENAALRQGGGGGGSGGVGLAPPLVGGALPSPGGGGGGRRSATPSQLEAVDAQNGQLRRELAAVDEQNQELRVQLQEFRVEVAAKDAEIGALNQSLAIADGGVDAGWQAAGGDGAAGGGGGGAEAAELRAAKFEARYYELRQDYDELAEENWGLRQESEAAREEAEHLRLETQQDLTGRADAVREVEQLRAKLERMENVFVGDEYSAYTAGSPRGTAGGTAAARQQQPAAGRSPRRQGGAVELEAEYGGYGERPAWENPRYAAGGAGGGGGGSGGLDSLDSDGYEQYRAVGAGAAASRGAPTVHDLHRSGGGGDGAEAVPGGLGRAGEHDSVQIYLASAELARQQARGGSPKRFPLRPSRGGSEASEDEPPTLSAAAQYSPPQPRRPAGPPAADGGGGGGGGGSVFGMLKASLPDHASPG